MTFLKINGGNIFSLVTCSTMLKWFKTEVPHGSSWSIESYKPLNLAYINSYYMSMSESLPSSQRWFSISGFIVNSFKQSLSFWKHLQRPVQDNFLALQEHLFPHAVLLQLQNEDCRTSSGAGGLVIQTYLREPSLSAVHPWPIGDGTSGSLLRQCPNSCLIVGPFHMLC